MDQSTTTAPTRQDYLTDAGGITAAAYQAAVRAENWSAAADIAALGCTDDHCTGCAAVREAANARAILGGCC
jgi:protein involved in polysaccharide export with SLBB domain